MSDPRSPIPAHQQHRSAPGRTRRLALAAGLAGAALLAGATAQAGPLTVPLPGEAIRKVLPAPAELALLGSALAGTEMAGTARVELVSHRRRNRSGSTTTTGSTTSGGTTTTGSTTTTGTTTGTTGGSTTGTRFATLPPGTVLPSGATCATRVRRSSWEPRPQNATANATVGALGASIDGANTAFNNLHAPRIDGNFTGTTDEILQWASCKWGFDEDITRARAVQESWWKQSQLGDQTSSVTACQIIGKSAPCWQSYGILQVKGTVHRRTYPLAERSTAYNADYALAWLRACYEGAFSHWMGNGYRAGDEWGCVGAWYSGNWYDAGAQWYISSVKQHLSARRWAQPGF